MTSPRPPIAEVNQLHLKIGMMPTDASVNPKVLRDGKTEQVTVKLAEFPFEARAGQRR